MDEHGRLQAKRHTKPPIMGALESMILRRLKVP